MRYRLSELLKSFSYPDGPRTARCRFIKNAYWVYRLIPRRNMSAGDTGVVMSKVSNQAKLNFHISVLAKMTEQQCLNSFTATGDNNRRLHRSR